MHFYPPFKRGIQTSHDSLTLLVDSVNITHLRVEKKNLNTVRRLKMGINILVCKDFAFAVL